MRLKVPDPEIIEYVLNVYFQDTELGGWATEDENGAIYIYKADGGLYAHLVPDTWFELLNYKEEEDVGQEATNQ